MAPSTQNLPQDVGIIGIGYVGLPLAVYFAQEVKVTAFDVNAQRVSELKNGFDRTGEVEADELKSCGVKFTDRKEDLKGLPFFIVTVPTPVDEHNVPDLTPIYGACDTLATVVTKGATIVFESTVYPGLTEEVVAPRLEKLTGLKFNRDFFLGYSPERVNPGDKEHTIPRIKKIVSGSTPETLELVAAMYSKIVKAGVHKARNIATAEAAKVIENIQRDVNIGLINELTVLFERLGLNVHEVLEASATKWNFLNFKPGLVGGHCIGVDPFYLTHKAQAVGFHPEMILAGRRVNDAMGDFFAGKFLQGLLARGVSPVGADILVLGFTFKENCPDVRNTKVAKMVAKLKSFGMKVDIVDPVGDPELARHEYGVELLKEVPGSKKYAAALLAVPHREILTLVARGVKELVGTSGFLFDIKGVVPNGPGVLH